MDVVVERFARRLMWFRQAVEGRLRGEAVGQLPDGPRSRVSSS